MQTPTTSQDHPIALTTDLGNTGDQGDHRAGQHVGHVALTPGRQHLLTELIAAAQTLGPILLDQQCMDPFGKFPVDGSSGRASSINIESMPETVARQSIQELIATTHITPTNARRISAAGRKVTLQKPSRLTMACERPASAKSTWSAKG